MYYLTLLSYYLGDLTLYLTVSITYLLITYTCMQCSTGRQAGRQYRQADRQADRHTYKHMCRAHSLLVNSLARSYIHIHCTLHPSRTVLPICLATVAPLRPFPPLSHQGIRTPQLKMHVYTTAKQVHGKERELVTSVLCL